jgi:hypothetical protein
VSEKGWPRGYSKYIIVLLIIAENGRLRESRRKS